jgi:hypothetical protein
MKVLGWFPGSDAPGTPFGGRNQSRYEIISLTLVFIFGKVAINQKQRKPCLIQTLPGLRPAAGVTPDGIGTVCNT